MAADTPTTVSNKEEDIEVLNNATSKTITPVPSIKDHHNEKAGATKADTLSNPVKEDDGDALTKSISKVENYPTGLKLVTVLACIYSAVFLVALDRNIIATALPQITDRFQSFADVGWVYFPPPLLIVSPFRLSN